MVAVPFCLSQLCIFLIKCLHIVALHFHWPLFVVCSISTLSPHLANRALSQLLVFLPVKLDFADIRQTHHKELYIFPPTFSKPFLAVGLSHLPGIRTAILQPHACPAGCHHPLLVCKDCKQPCVCLTPALHDEELAPGMLGDARAVVLLTPAAQRLQSPDHGNHCSRFQWCQLREISAHE